MSRFGTFLEVVARSRSLQSAAVTRSWQPTLIGYGDAERLDGQSVSGDYFRVLGVRPAIGRDFSQADDRPVRRPVAIITDGLWRRRFGGDASVIGRTIRLDGAAVTIVGIMPRTFENVWSAQAQIWRPLGYDPSLPAAGPRVGTPSAADRPRPIRQQSRHDEPRAGVDRANAGRAVQSSGVGLVARRLFGSPRCGTS